MKIILFLAVIILFTFPVPCLADTGSGVSIPLTVTVTGGGGVVIPPGDGPHPYTNPDWTSLFPSMNQPQSSASSYTAPQQTYIPIPEPARVATSAAPTDSTTPAISPIKTTPEMDRAVWAGIAFWAIAIGLFVWLLSWLVDRRRKPVQ